MFNQYKVRFLFGLTLCLSFLFAQPSFEPSLPDSEMTYVIQALKATGIEPYELGFEKKWATDSIFMLKIVKDLLDHPLRTPRYADSAKYITEALANDLPALLLYQAQQLDVPISAKDTVLLNREIEKKSGIRNESALGGLKLINSAFEVGDKYLKQAIKKMSQEEITKLLIQAPILWGDEDDSSEHYLKGALHREFGIEVDTSRKITGDTILLIVPKLNRRDLTLSVMAVALAVNKIRAILTKSALGGLFRTPNSKFQIPDVKGNVYYYEETKMGKFVIGSEEDNIYDGDFALIIDLGGNDKYQGRTGGAIGILSHPFSVCIDLAGNDVYDGNQKLFNLGSAIFGCGILLDLKGDDVYRGHHYAQGAGLFGTGILIDDDGKDFYQAGYYAQGAGNFGFGLLIDNISDTQSVHPPKMGEDVYHSYDYCQGFASILGYGLLSDLAGNDVYYAGGKYIHHPLLPNDYRSFSQGFAIGWRPDASGGIGFLYDKSGNDFYNGDVFTQGCSYWYSLGMLYDEQGQDHYSASEYAQGAGIHLSVGILIDKEGDDYYYSRLGPSQGEGHDLSVGILIDRKGKDYYSASGGQGIGLTNSFGLFLDAEGDDSYMTVEPNFGQGTANWARGFGGSGVFLDLDGADKYVQGSLGKDRNYWTQGTYGSGIDLRGAKKIEEKKEEEIALDTIKRPVEEVFKEASIWEVGEAIQKVKKARKELINLGMEAIRYVAKEKMATKDGLELRAIEELAKALPDSIKPFLFQALHDERRYARANAIYLLGQIKAKDAIDSLLVALKDKRNRPRAVISAFGEIGERRIVPDILPYLKHKDEPTRIYTAWALSKLKDPRGVTDLIKALDDHYFTVRSAAEQALVNIGDSALPSLLDCMRQNAGCFKQQKLAHIIRASAEIASKLDTIEKRKERIQVRKMLLKFIDNSCAYVRGVAVEGLGKLIDEPTKKILEAKMTEETDEFVLSQYRKIYGRD
uniref:HEAT repeat domain-containing protein n=1 Tax=candidate division WOR-3 bacterium TaxID=2052148 RepID=A0A7C6ECG0_UNCW3